MRALVVLLWLLPAIARADGAADRDLLIEYKRLAVDASRTGNCDPARELAVQVKSMDPVFFANEYATDPAIASCLPPPNSPAAIAPVDGSAPLAPPPGQQVDAPEAPRIPFYPPDRPSVPPLDGGRVLGEILLGGVVGLGGALVGGLIGSKLCDNNSSSDDFGCVAAIVIGGYLVGSVGFGVGVSIVGRSGGQTGSTGAAVGGAVLGSLVGVLALLALEDTSDELIAGVLIAAPVLGGMIGFNVTRRWKPQQTAIGSLFRFDRGGVSLGVPVVIHAEQRGVATTSVPLFSGSF